MIWYPPKLEFFILVLAIQKLKKRQIYKLTVHFMPHCGLVHLSLNY